MTAQVQPRLLQTFLPDGTLEGVRIIELSESAIKVFVIPRIKINDVKDRTELKQPALYLLINAGDNQLYIGESENFYERVKSHDQAKDFWDLAVAVVSQTNSLEKGDVKYLESLAIEIAKPTAAMDVLNKKVPARNNIHEFKLHSLRTILEDTAFIVEALGYSIFATKQDETQETWFCSTKKTRARAQFRGDSFVILAGSIIDKKHTPAFEAYYPHSVVQRMIIMEKYGRDMGDTVELTQNVPFKSPNTAGGFATGRSINAWVMWKDDTGRTMDEIMRRGQS